MELRVKGSEDKVLERRDIQKEREREKEREGFLFYRSAEGPLEFSTEF